MKSNLLKKFNSTATVLLFLAYGANAQGALIWDFNLPAASSYSGIYESMGTLTLEDITGGVKATFDPNEANPGYTKNNNLSHVIDLDIVYKGPNTVTLGTESNSSSDVVIKSFNYETNQNNIGTGYSSNDQHIKISWETGNGQNPGPYLVNEIAMWTMLGATVADFENTFAETNSGMPNPIVGVLSVSAFAHPNQIPNPSNWVAGYTPPPPTCPPDCPPNNVPEPSIIALFGLGILGLGLARRRVLN